MRGRAAGVALLLLPLSALTGFGQGPTPAAPASAEAPRPGAPQDTADAPGHRGEALTLHFLHVGQGDAVLVQEPGGGAVLYDGGPDPDRALAHLQALEVEALDLVVASHPHRDHIGGLPAVLDEYEPELVLDNGLNHPTLAYERYLEAVRDSGGRLLEPTARTITLGDARLRVLPPPDRPEWDQNDNSVGLVVERGDFRAVLAGDAETRQWEWWLEEERVPRDVEVHKASHHGSRNGDVEGAVERLAPEVVVIGVGSDNTYGHPHREALALYAGAGAEVYRTDRHGTVRVTVGAEGDYHVKAERDGDALAGEEVVPAGEECVNVNEASPRGLEEILHIGASRARAVVELRREREFDDLESLARVPGLGEARVEEIIEEGVACAK